MLTHPFDWNRMPTIQNRMNWGFMKIEWDASVISENGLWVKKDAASKRVFWLRVLVAVLNILMWAVILFK